MLMRKTFSDYIKEAEEIILQEQYPVIKEVSDILKSNGYDFDRASVTEALNLASEKYTDEELKSDFIYEAVKANAIELLIESGNTYPIDMFFDDLFKKARSDGFNDIDIGNAFNESLVENNINPDFDDMYVAEMTGVEQYFWEALDHLDEIRNPKSINEELIPTQNGEDLRAATMAAFKSVVGDSVADTVLDDEVIPLAAQMGEQEFTQELSGKFNSSDFEGIAKLYGMIGGEKAMPCPEAPEIAEPAEIEVTEIVTGPKADIIESDPEEEVIDDVETELPELGPNIKPDPDPDDPDLVPEDLEEPKESMEEVAEDIAEDIVEDAVEEDEPEVPPADDEEEIEEEV